MTDTRRMKKTMEKMKNEMKVVLAKEKLFENSVPRIQHDQVVVSMKSENQMLRDKVSNLEAQVFNRKKDIEALTSEKDHLELRLRESIADVRERDNKLHSLRKNNMHELEEAHRKIAALQKTIDETDIKDVRRRLERKTEEINGLNSQLREANHKARELEKTEKWLRAELERLKKLDEPKAEVQPSAA